MLRSDSNFNAIWESFILKVLWGGKKSKAASQRVKLNTSHLHTRRNVGSAVSPSVSNMSGF